MKKRLIYLIFAESVTTNGNKIVTRYWCDESLQQVKEDIARLQESYALNPRKDLVSRTYKYELIDFYPIKS